MTTCLEVSAEPLRASYEEEPTSPRLPLHRRQNTW